MKLHEIIMMMPMHAQLQQQQLYGLNVMQSVCIPTCTDGDLYTARNQITCTKWVPTLLTSPTDLHSNTLTQKSSVSFR